MSRISNGEMWFSVKEAAIREGYSDVQFRRLLAAGLIEFYQPYPNARIEISQSQLDAFRERCRQNVSQKERQAA